MKRADDLDVVAIEDARVLASFLSREPALHAYELGDLDPFFWPYTRWWGLERPGGELASVVLLYEGPATSTVIALDREGVAGDLLARIEPSLPRRFNAHASPGAAERLSPRRRLVHHGRHLKMALGRLVPPPAPHGLRVDPLTAAHGEEVRAFLDQAYPANWFDPRMLETGHYVCIREGGRLACVAGVHVYSPVHRVAALGNIATRADLRGRGLAACATAALCEKLRRTVDVIGLNVHAENAAAIACYARLGFVEVAPFDEWAVEMS